MDMNEITEYGKDLIEACMLYYDMVNKTENVNICVGLIIDVKHSDTGKEYRYNVKIEKEEL